MCCPKCRTVARFIEEYRDPPYYEAGEISLIKCSNLDCRNSWCYCAPCKKTLSKPNPNSLRKHHAGRNHQGLSKKVSDHLPLPPFVARPDPPAGNSNDVVVQDAPTDTPCHDTAMGASLQDTATVTSLLALPHEDSGSNDVDMLTNESTRILHSICHSDNDSTMDLVAKAGAPEEVVSILPTIDLSGNEWLEEALKDIPLASTKSIYEVFGEKPELEKMKNFWVAELATGAGRCGGGLMYLAARAFQQVKDSQLDRNRIPDYDESRWHLEYMIQHNTTNQKTRNRQFNLVQALANRLPAKAFFKETFVPLRSNNNQAARLLFLTVTVM